MRFIDREEELSRLDRLMQAAEGRFAVLYGRRRIGKTRLLLEWSARHDGLYWVADLSAPAIQRRYFAEAIGRHISGFADVEYPDWWGLLSRLARDAKAIGFRGPVILDELPYLVIASPELPSVIQRWIDHDAREAGLVVAVSGSSQRMMQGIVLSRGAPLFGRAQVVMDLREIEASHLDEVLPEVSVREKFDFHVAWGGVPRYWELALDIAGDVFDQVDRLVLDPLGPLHREPDRLLLEETPSAIETRPVLDAIGGGVHRISEIAGRMGRPATSITKALQRLIELGLVERQVPFGENELRSKRGLYRIADPFTRLWFRVVAPARSHLASVSRNERLGVLRRHWSALSSWAWEELCRRQLPRTEVGAGRSWGLGGRWWRANEPEWDVVAASLDDECLLLGEAKWTVNRPSVVDVRRWQGEVQRRRPPRLPSRFQDYEVVRALFVLEVPEDEPRSELGDPGVVLVTAKELLR